MVDENDIKEILTEEEIEYLLEQLKQIELEETGAKSGD